MRVTGVAVMLGLGALACRRQPEALKAVPRAHESAGLSLPAALEGFSASSEEAGAGYARRTYKHGRTRIDVTLAQAPLPPGGFAGWLSMSRGFPQATLDAPEAEANGFYQCTDVPKPSCDLLIQMRSGVHVEIRGGGTSSRADVDAVARGLPLRALATSAPTFPTLPPPSPDAR
jgi:hypothetical protein